MTVARRVIGFVLIAAGACFLLYDAYMTIASLALVWPATISWSPSLEANAPEAIALACIAVGVLVIKRRKSSKGSTGRDG